MKSVHRIALTVAGLVTVTMLSGVFVVQGYVAGKQAAAMAALPAASDPPATLAPLIVYVNPAPAVPPPAQIQQPVQAPQAAQDVAVQPPVQPQVIHVIVPSRGDDDGTDG